MLLALIVYRIGTHVPVPGIDSVVLKDLFNSQENGILGMFDMFSGGALSRFSIFALGIMPYISASIIMQLGTVAVPYLESLKKKVSLEEKDNAIYSLRYAITFYITKLRYFFCFAISARVGSGTWHAFYIYNHYYACDWIHIPYVAW